MKSLILVLNSGSSSIKFQLFDAETERTSLQGLIENIGSDQVCLHYQADQQKHSQALLNTDYAAAFNALVPIILNAIPKDAKLVAIGHRVVHGGRLLTQSVVINEAVIAQIARCSVLAPLHNPPNLLGIEASQKAFPDIPQVAVFDTAFHQTVPEHAYLYALPYHYYSDYDVRRYGFHGISYQYLVQEAAILLKQPANELALICAHLGNGCSACATLNGKSVDTTMGFTPLEGLIMGTRSGDIDPGLFEYLTQKLNISVTEFTKILNKQSGLLGISNLSFDMRELEKAAQAGHSQAALAIEMFCYRLAKSIAALAVPLGRIDALVFAGGIGENARLIREKTLSELAFLGFKLDATRNSQHGMNSAGRITEDAAACALVIKTQEELMIAREVKRLL